MAGNLALSVSQLNEYVRRMLQLDPMLSRVDLKGEISNLKMHQSGMLFFTMKDEQASIACAMSAEAAVAMQAEPFEGMRAVASGSVGLYARGGRYQFYVSALHPQGMGVLYERLQALREKLGREGLFDQERKRPLPVLCGTVGVVSSPTGAVIHDILNVSLRRDAQARILLCPARVQGVGAAQEIVRAIKTLEQIPSVDVIIVARGGGSMEDLWTFNEECVVRAVASCKKPVVSAVGHETDVTLCDLAADLRAPTPSAAAECVVAVREELRAQLDALTNALSDAALGAVERAQARLSVAGAQLGAWSPAQRLGRETERLDQLRERLRGGMRRRFDALATLLEHRKRELALLSPYGALERGYAIVLRGGVPVESGAALAGGDEVTLKMKDASVRARVLGREEEDA